MEDSGVQVQFTMRLPERKTTILKKSYELARDDSDTEIEVKIKVGTACYGFRSSNWVDSDWSSVVCADLTLPFDRPSD
jgi:hypothetical protein